jgi:hypothetical protein
VSGGRRRLEGPCGTELDAAFLSPRLLAMAFPAVGLEALARNPRRAVARLLAASSGDGGGAEPSTAAAAATARRSALEAPEDAGGAAAGPSTSAAAAAAPGGWVKTYNLCAEAGRAYPPGALGAGPHAALPLFDHMARAAAAAAAGLG